MTSWPAPSPGLTASPPSPRSPRPTRARRPTSWARGQRARHEGDGEQPPPRRFLDDPAFDVLLARFERLAYPLYLLPADPCPRSGTPATRVRPGRVVDPQRGRVGWHAEPGLRVLGIVLGGVFDRHLRAEADRQPHRRDAAPVHARARRRQPAAKVTSLDRVASSTSSAASTSPPAAFALPCLLWADRLRRRPHLLLRRLAVCPRRASPSPARHWPLIPDASAHHPRKRRASSAWRPSLRARRRRRPRRAAPRHRGGHKFSARVPIMSSREVPKAMSSATMRAHAVATLRRAGRGFGATGRIQRDDARRGT